jgi:hypothetical protein
MALLQFYLQAGCGLLLTAYSILSPEINWSY